MSNPKKLIKLARKWQKFATITRILLTSANGDINSNCRSRSSSTSVADKGHFVVYSVDKKRYVFPISYLKSDVFRVLLKLSEEEFGLPSDGPITLPCDAVFMDYMVSLVQHLGVKDVEKALVLSIATGRCSMSCSLHQEEHSQQLLGC